MALLFQIVLTFAKIGILSFGGGYAAIPLVQEQVVEVNRWMTNEEFMNVLAIDELTPGPIAVNCATFVGTRMAGIPGAIAATLGCVLPSCIIAFILVKIYLKYKNMTIMNGALGGLKCMVVALILSTTITLMQSSLFANNVIDYFAIVIFLIALFVLRKYKPEPILVILACGALGLIYSLII